MATNQIGHHRQHRPLVFENKIIEKIVWALILAACILILSGVRQAFSQPAQVYYANRDLAEIWRGSLDGVARELVYEGRRFNPQAIALDVDSSGLYWTEYTTTVDPETFETIYTGFVYRMSLDGADLEELVVETKQPKGIALDVEERTMYWVDKHTGTFYRARMDGTDQEALFEFDDPTFGSFSGFAVDAAAEKIYWANLHTIWHASFEGADIDTVVSDLDLSYSQSFALDQTGGKIYYINRSKQAVERINLDGTAHETIVVSEGLRLAGSIALDLQNEHVYWENTSKSVLFRSNLDGTAVEEVAAGIFTVGLAVDPGPATLYLVERDRIGKKTVDGTTVKYIVASNYIDEIELDLVENKMYWIDDGANRIYRANLDGTEVEAVVEDGRISEIAIDSERKRLIWSNDEAGTIHRANLDGSAPEQIVSLGKDRLQSFILEPDRGHIYWTETSTLVVYRARLDGSRPEPFFEPAADAAPWRLKRIDKILAVDPVRSRVFGLGEFEEIHDRPVVWRANIDGSQMVKVNVWFSGKSWYGDVRLPAEYDFVYAIHGSVNPPVVHERLHVVNAEGNPVTPFYNLDLRTPDRITSIAYDWRHIDQPASPAVVGLTLIDAVTDEPIDGYDPILDGALIDLSQLPLGLNIRANMMDRVESVEFSVNGWSTSRIENLPPYAFLGDVGGDYAPGRLPYGERTITVTGFSEDQGGGEAGEPYSINLTVRTGTDVTGFTVVDVVTGNDVMELEDGATINPADLPPGINIRAEVLGGVGSVRFELDPDGYERTESVAPFALFGDIDGEYLAGELTSGSHTLRATPYERAGLKGWLGTPFEVQFTVEEGASSSKTSIMTAGASELAQTAKIPKEFVLNLNYPNPFNPSTTISYALPEEADVRLAVFDVSGRRLRTLVDRAQPAGMYEVHFDAGHLPSGLYVYRLEAGAFASSRIMLFVK